MHLPGRESHLSESFDCRFINFNGDIKRFCILNDKTFQSLFFSQIAGTKFQLQNKYPLTRTLNSNGLEWFVAA